MQDNKYKKDKKDNVLLIDFSTVFYGQIFSATNAVKDNLKMDENGKYNLSEYKFAVIQKVLDEIALLRYKFSAKEVIIAVDSREGYWRKGIWKGYKSKRKEARDKSPINWEQAFNLHRIILDIFRKCTIYKVLEVPKVEGDDIIFVLSKYIAKRGNIAIIYSSDHDFIQLLLHDNIRYYRTTRTIGMENSSFYEASPKEIKELISEHVINGDPGDGFGNIKQFSVFSDEFLEMYPKMRGKEIEAYDKRFDIDTAFMEKTGKSAYKHPRFGYKMMKRSKEKKTLKEILKENLIYRKNFEMNCKLALPKYIPFKIKRNIIKTYNSYNNNKTKKEKIKCLRNLFKKRMRELNGKILYFV